jgi:hypothetical protein
LPIAIVGIVAAERHSRQIVKIGGGWQRSQEQQAQGTHIYRYQEGHLLAAGVYFKINRDD